MYTVRYRGKKGVEYKLEESSNFLAVRSATRSPVYRQAPQETTPLSNKARSIMEEFVLEYRLPLVGVEIWRTKEERGARALRNEARKTLKQEPALRFAGRVVQDRVSKAPVLYTENLFVKFANRVSETECQKLLNKHNLKVKRPLIYAPNAYFVEATEGIGLEVFGLSAEILDATSVELCHPELVREPRSRSAFPQQWHLKRSYINGKSVNAHANVEAAWAITRGEGTTIAVIDTGIDIDHEEFSSTGKVVSPLNASVPSTHPNRLNPRPGNHEYHGTACAGVACGDGEHGASGVAPKARLMPIRFVSGLGSQDEADAFVHAAQFGADVISCSWGPDDGDWWDTKDPLHKQVVTLPDSTRLAIDFATKFGRGGKGCVIVWAAGNGNESVDNDGYASYEKVIAVAACSDRSTRSVYSDFGEAIWCAFPSSDFANGNSSEPLTPGIWTTDVSGSRGYNLGFEENGDVAGNYTNDFGGTSSAAPGVAGVAALALSANPELSWNEVRDIIKESCEQIDKEKGKYNKQGHSHRYGYGRINAVGVVNRANAGHLDAQKSVGRQRGVEKGSLRSNVTASVDPFADLKKFVREELLNAIIPAGDHGNWTWEDVALKQVDGFLEGLSSEQHHPFVTDIQDRFMKTFSVKHGNRYPGADELPDDFFWQFRGPNGNWQVVADSTVSELA